MASFYIIPVFSAAGENDCSRRSWETERWEKLE